MRINIPDLGSFSEDCGLKRLAKCSDDRFEAGKDGVTGIYCIHRTSSSICTEF